jgi:hypothetical protein
MPKTGPMQVGFPVLGKHVGFPSGKQPLGTSPSMKNVRPYDVLEQRARGGQRPALDKWGAGTQIGGANQPVVAMCLVSVRVT